MFTLLDCVQSLQRRRYSGLAVSTLAPALCPSLAGPRAKVKLLAIYHCFVRSAIIAQPIPQVQKPKSEVTSLVKKSTRILSVSSPGDKQDAELRSYHEKSLGKGRGSCKRNVMCAVTSGSRGLCSSPGQITVLYH